MTITEDIQDAMQHGASAMFLIGLLNYYRADRSAAINAIEKAGEAMRIKREVKLGKVYARSLQTPPRRHEPELEQEW